MIQQILEVSRRDPMGLGPVGMIIPLIIGVAFVALFIYVAQYIYKDAHKRNLNAELWLIIVFIAPIVSWIVYFIVRKTGATRSTESTEGLKEVKA